MLLMTFFFLSALLAFDPGMICQGFLLLESLCTSALFFLLSENIFDFYYNRRLGDIYIYIYVHIVFQYMSITKFPRINVAAPFLLKHLHPMCHDNRSHATKQGFRIY